MLELLFFFRKKSFNSEYARECYFQPNLNKKIDKIAHMNWNKHNLKAIRVVTIYVNLNEQRHYIIAVYVIMLNSLNKRNTGISHYKE